jgi:hypothetical protein
MLRQTLLTVGCTVLFAIPVIGQQAGQIVGLVTDSSGGVVLGAVVKATETGSGTAMCIMSRTSILAIRGSKRTDLDRVPARPRSDCNEYVAGMLDWIFKSEEYTACEIVIVHTRSNVVNSLLLKELRPL